MLLEKRIQVSVIDNRLFNRNSLDIFTFRPQDRFRNLVSGNLRRYHGFS